MERKQLFFDLDGTLCDSLLGIQNGIQYALMQNEMPPLSDATLKKMIGIPLRESLKMFVFNETDMDYPKYENTILSFREYYSEKGVFESTPYNGVREILNSLIDQYELYVITAKPQELAIEMLQYHSLSHLFKGIAGYNKEQYFSKAKLIQVFRNTQEGVMIGDKEQDISAGRELGLATVGVLYGYGAKLELQEAGSDYFIDSPSELLKLV